VNWLTDLFFKPSIPQTVVVLGCIAICGLALGSIKFKGIGLGIAGVLFAGIGFGHFGFHLNDAILEFVREFGLILFVYTVGLQVGPGFLSSLRRDGIWLNALALGTVVLGAIVAALWHWEAKVPISAVAGIYSGATTNTPSLAAGQTALASLATGLPDAAAISGMAYAIAYPFGVFGIILTMLITKLALRMNPDTEAKTGSDQTERSPTNLALEVTNQNLEGVFLNQIPFLEGSGVVVSRLLRGEQVFVPESATRIALGDVLNLVGPLNQLRRFIRIIGRESAIDVKAVPSKLTTERVYVTRRAVIGRTLKELDFESLCGAVITRVTRAEIEFTAGDDVQLQFGDLLLVVGSGESVQRVAKIVGNRPKALDHPHLLTVFLGIVLGAILGAVPIALPGMPAPLQLGLAGGPLLVAIAISQVGRLGPLVSYLSPGANFVLREFGITLFLAAVGLKSGGHFFEVLFSGPGWLWMLSGATVTLIPLLSAALIGRLLLKIKFVRLCGMLAGSMTDPPGACICDRFHLFGGATAGLCSRLSGNHDSESLRRADSGVSSGEVILATPELQLPLMFPPRQSGESFQPAKR
jgi:putative transport protein